MNDSQNTLPIEQAISTTVLVKVQVGPLSMALSGGRRNRHPYPPAELNTGSADLVTPDAMLPFARSFELSRQNKKRGFQ